MQQDRAVSSGARQHLSGETTEHDARTRLMHPVVERNPHGTLV